MSIFPYLPFLTLEQGTESDMLIVSTPDQSKVGQYSVALTVTSIGYSQRSTQLLTGVSSGELQPIKYDFKVTV